MNEWALFIIQAFLRRGGGSKAMNVSKGMKWKKGITTIPRSKLLKPKFGKQWEGRTGRKTMRQGQTFSLPNTPSNGGERNLPLRRGQKFEY